MFLQQMASEVPCHGFSGRGTSLVCCGVDHFGEFLGAGPHRPVPSGQVDGVDMCELGHFREHGITRSGQLENLSARDRTADESGWRLASCVIGQGDGFTGHCSRFWNGSCSETSEGLTAETLEACLLPQHFEIR